MPFQCEWKVPGKVLYSHVGLSLTIEEIEALTQSIDAMIVRDGLPPVYLIIDASDFQRMPLPLSQMRRVIGDAQSIHVGCYIIITTNLIYGFTAAALVKLMRRPIRVVTTYDEALKALSALDSDLAAGLNP